MTLPFAIPTLETDRLILREPRESDLEPMAAFGASDRARFVGGPLSRWDTWRALLAGIGHWALRGYGFWSVDLRDSGRMIGRVGVTYHDGWSEPELGWHLYDGAEGKGLAHEAALAARAFARTGFGLGPLISHIAPDNARSIRLAERLGARMERRGVLKGTLIHIYRHPEAIA